MTLQETLTAELKAAMVARNADRTATLRLVKSALGYVQIEKKVDQLPDADVTAVLQREAKKRRDARDEYERGGRPELAAKEAAELVVIEEFLPKALSAEELEALVRAVIAETGATSKRDMGTVMKAAQARAAGRTEGKVLSGIVGRLLP
ncbi:MAG: GatB/YqeY domain-containing protein [Verrucomicrobiales bacterium]|nr:GatB/YqeY domain-containing protein [Verrucomicrobiales bacterium]